MLLRGRRAQWLSLFTVAALALLAGCNAIAGIVDGHLVDGGPGGTAGDASVDAGSDSPTEGGGSDPFVRAR